MKQIYKPTLFLVLFQVSVYRRDERQTSEQTALLRNLSFNIVEDRVNTVIILDKE